MRSAIEGNGRPFSDLPFAVPRALRRRLTPHEVKIWNWLRESIAPLGYHFRRQAPIGRFVVDFACLKARVIIEIDGEQHGREEALREADGQRDAALASIGYRVLRFTNREVDQEKHVVLDTILAALEGRRGTATDPPPEGEVAGAAAPDGGGPPGRGSPSRFGFADSALPSAEGSPRRVYGAD